MLHPNEVAIEYLWGKLKDWCITAETNNLLDKMENLLLFNDHRPMSDINHDSHKLKVEENEQRILDMIASHRVN